MLSVFGLMVTLGPLAFMCVNTLTAGWMNIGINYLRPQLKAGAPSLWRAFLDAPAPARIQCVVTLLLMTLLIVVVLDSLRHWTRALRRPRLAPGPAPFPLRSPAS